MHDSRTTPYIIGISGPSGSGKTTIASKVAAKLEQLGYTVATMSQDYYYKDQRDIAIEQRPETNYDIPDAFEHDLLIEHLQCLKQGEFIEAPIYEFSQHTRNLTMTQSIAPADIIIIEGILLFHDNRVAKQLNYKLFINTPDKACYRRRLLRDIKERGRTEESVKKTWEERVVRSIQEFIRPSAEKADSSIDNSISHKEVDAKISQLSEDISKMLETAKKKRKVSEENPRHPKILKLAPAYCQFGGRNNLFAKKQKPKKGPPYPHTSRLASKSHGIK